MVHVVPVDDLKPHDTSDKGNTCHCNPRVIIEPESDIIVVHNSFDGREGLEWAEEILKQK